MVDFSTKSQADFDWVTVDDFHQGDLLAYQERQSPWLWGSIPLRLGAASFGDDRRVLHYDLPDGAWMISVSPLTITAGWEQNRRVVSVAHEAKRGGRFLGRLIGDKEWQRNQENQRTHRTEELEALFYTGSSPLWLLSAEDFQAGDLPEGLDVLLKAGER